MSSTENKHSPQELKKKIQELEKVLSGTKERLQEANDTLEAIRTGAVDGLVRQTPHGNQVFLLKGSEEAYRSLIERMNEGAILLSENGTILYCNESFAGLLKAPLDRVISGDITNWISKGSTKTFEELSDCIKNKAQKNVFEIAFQTAKDETVPTLVSVNRISIDSLNVIALIVTDLRVHMEEDVKRYTASLVNEITERKKAEEALTKSEKQYRQLFDSLPEGLVTVEMVYENNRAVDFRFLEVNPSYAKLIGKQSVDEVVGKTTREAVGVLEDYWYQLYDGVVKTGESVHYENYVKALDEYYEVVAWKTRENKVAILCYNVTLRKKAEEALKVSEAHYRGLFDNMGDAFMLLEVIKDKKGEPCDFRYLELNAAYEKQTGIKPSEILGKTTKEVYPDSEKYWQDVFGGVEKTGIPARFENYSAPLWRFYDTYAFPVAKNQIGVIVRDITERKKAEEELKRQLSLRNSRNIILMEVLKAKTFEDLGEACL